METKSKDGESPTSESAACKVSELSIWTNTPEEERLEIEAFMEGCLIDAWESLPPYDWGEGALGDTSIDETNNLSATDKK